LLLGIQMVLVAFVENKPKQSSKLAGFIPTL
jgi:hypothetical protein